MLAHFMGVHPFCSSLLFSNKNAESFLPKTAQPKVLIFPLQYSTLYTLYSHLKIKLQLKMLNIWVSADLNIYSENLQFTLFKFSGMSNNHYTTCYITILGLLFFKFSLLKNKIRPIKKIN